MKIIYISLILAILFVILSLPDVYLFMDRNIPHRYIRFTYDNCPGLPTLKGKMSIGFVFFCISYLLLQTKLDTSKEPVEDIKIENNEIPSDLEIPQPS